MFNELNWRENMKKLIPLLMLFSIYNIAFAERSNNLDNFVASTPNIVLGKVFCLGTTYFLVDIGWELKGKLNSEFFEVVVNDKSQVAKELKEGDRVLMFIRRREVKPIKKVPLKNLQLSDFDDFDGQCAFMKIKNDKDYTIISDVYSKVAKEDLASAFSF
jgi:hypothetical protein